MIKITFIFKKKSFIPLDMNITYNNSFPTEKGRFHDAEVNRSSRIDNGPKHEIREKSSEI